MTETKHVYNQRTQFGRKGRVVNLIESDIAIVGAGGAGLRAAIASRPRPTWTRRD
jgi:ribulose 1,5-bisphosphate synthetase/thiazole synthase